MESQQQQENSQSRTEEEEDNCQDGETIDEGGGSQQVTEEQSLETEDASAEHVVANGYNQTQTAINNIPTLPLNIASSINLQKNMTVYGIPDFSQLNLAAELCAEIKTRLPPMEDDEKLLTDDLLQFLEGKILYHDKLENTIQIQTNSMLHCNCNHCIYHHTDVMPPSQLFKHLGHSITSFKLMVKQSLGDGIQLGDMLKIINTDLIDTHIGHCCRCRMGRMGDEKLIQCDGCPLSYHSFCVGLQKPPEQEWYCPKCIQFGRGGKKRFIHNQQQQYSQKYQQNRKFSQQQPSRISKRKSESGRITPPNGASKQVNRTQTMTGNKFKNQRLFSQEAGLLKDGQEVWYRSNRENILRGNVVLSGDVRGICCSCCNQVVSMSTFEKHAGFGHRRAPYDCVYILNGPNLKELAQKLPNDESLDFVLSRRRRRRVSVRRTTTTAKRSTQSNQSKEIDFRTKLIFKRFENIINELEKCPPGCYICHKEEFDAEFSDLTMIICDQCEREFHIGCLRSQEICDLQNLPKGSWFCSKECRCVNDGLREKIDEDEFEFNENYQVRFMRGTREDNNQQSPLFSQACALELIRESFDPIKDGVTGTDLLPYMVKSDVTEDGVWDFAGMCTLLLKFNYKIVGAATFRIFGNLVGEIPLVAVKSSERGRGHCRVMINIIQQLFQDLNVQIMILPAAQTTLNMWRHKFACRPLGATRAKELRNFAKYMCFPDCTMVYKYLDAGTCVEYDDEDISDILRMPEQEIRELENKDKENQEVKNSEETTEKKINQPGKQQQQIDSTEKQIKTPEKQVRESELEPVNHPEKQLIFTESQNFTQQSQNYSEQLPNQQEQLVPDLQNEIMEQPTMNDEQPRIYPEQNFGHSENLEQPKPDKLPEISDKKLRKQEKLSSRQLPEKGVIKLENQLPFQQEDIQTQAEQDVVYESVIQQQIQSQAQKTQVEFQSSQQQQQQYQQQQYQQKPFPKKLVIKTENFAAKAENPLKRKSKKELKPLIIKKSKIPQREPPQSQPVDVDVLNGYTTPAYTPTPTPKLTPTPTPTPTPKRAPNPTPSAPTPTPIPAPKLGSFYNPIGAENGVNTASTYIKDGYYNNQSQKIHSQQDENHLSKKNYQQQQQNLEQGQVKKKNILKIKQKDKNNKIVLKTGSKIQKQKKNQCQISTSGFKLIPLQISLTTLPPYFLAKSNRNVGFHRVCIVQERRDEDPIFDNVVFICSKSQFKSKEIGRI